MTIPEAVHMAEAFKLRMLTESVGDAAGDKGTQ